MHYEHDSHCCGQAEQTQQQVHVGLGHMCTAACVHNGALGFARQSEQLLQDLHTKKRKRKRKLGEWSLFDSTKTWLDAA